MLLVFALAIFIGIAVIAYNSKTYWVSAPLVVVVVYIAYVAHFLV